jgi:hypothetical protein
MMTDSRMRRGVTIRQRLGDLLLVSSLAALIWSVAALLTGGFVLTAGGVSVVSKDPLRPLGIAVALAAVGAWALGRERSSSRLTALAGRRANRPVHVAVIAALAAFAMGAAWNTRAAGGSDSSCYVLQAEAFAHGDATLQPVLTDLPAGVSQAALAPTGFIASPAPPHASVPICAPGLALMMAALLPAGGELVFLVVPVFAGLLVWWTFAFARRIADPGIAACAAVLLACSPIFLYQAVQPMSDVPAAALFMGALVFALRGGNGHLFIAGLLASLAVLTRPNLAVVVAPIIMLLPGSSPISQRGLSAFLWFALGAAPAGIVMLMLNAARYGGALASGYGDSGVLFAWAHVAPNLARYPRWLLETQSPLLLLALGAPVVLWARGLWRVALVAILSVAAAFATYLAYTVFDDWWYIRFLLPALPILVVFMTMTLFTIATRLSAAHGRAAALIVCALLASWYMDVAHRRHAMDLRSLEARFRVTGEYAARALPPSAVALAVQHSGSVRFYGRRPTLAWDGIDSGALDAVIASFIARGLTPFIVLEDAEEQRFRDRFAAQSYGQLDWPPAAEIHGRVRVRIYNPAERVSYLKGQRVETEHIR